MERRKVKNGENSCSRRSLLFFVPHFSDRLDFPSSPLSAPGSPRMVLVRIIPEPESAYERFNALASYGLGVRETNCAIQWILSYPMNSVIHLLNNWGQEYGKKIPGQILRHSPTL